MSRMHYGVAPHLEAEANRILRTSLRDVHSPAAKSDILTKWKESERRRHEAHVTGGVDGISGMPDSAVRRGIFTRSINPARPELNSRDGHFHPRKDPGGSLASFIESPLDRLWDQQDV